jgi:hypothetical protein
LRVSLLDIRPDVDLTPPRQFISPAFKGGWFIVQKTRFRIKIEVRSERIL